MHDASPIRADAVYSHAPPPAAADMSPPAERVLSELAPLPATITGSTEIVTALNEGPLPAVPTLDDLSALGLPDELIEGLWELVDNGENARAVAIIFLYLLSGSPAGSALDRRQRRLILSAYKKLQASAATVSAVRRVWNDWDPPGGGAPACP